ncbi:hypothetical protein LOTGIDRAFT_168790 [Lottia gigantea]|uniref:Uncharacterized protein n=1 Tax=Lottia gigantea TaxID=225164 RepID=V3ZTX3_LOTGI|nr:hypothetical protein LOTGIDRAFT_168790 [Lottia gigantea]ESO84346.1 hypothetical protein LOTGIDRAFT_168790 [Lottia gigantea]
MRAEEKHSSHIDNKESQEMDPADPLNMNSEEKAIENSNLTNEGDEELPETASKDQLEEKLSPDIEADESPKEDVDLTMVFEDLSKKETDLKMIPGVRTEVEGEDTGSQPTPKSCDTSEDEIKQETADKDQELPQKEDSSSKRLDTQADTVSSDSKELPKNSEECIGNISVTTQDSKVEELPPSKEDQAGNDSKGIPEEVRIGRDSNDEEKAKASKDPLNPESQRTSDYTDPNVQAKNGDLNDHQSKSITESKNFDVKEIESGSRESLTDTKKVVKPRQSISVTDTRFVRSVAHSIKLLNSNKSALLKIVDYSESDSEIDSEAMDSRQMVFDSNADQQSTDPVIEASTDEPSSGSTVTSSNDAVADPTSSKSVDEYVEEDAPKEESKTVTESEKKPREAHFKSGELLTSIASKDFSSKDLPMSVADNLSKMPKIGSTVITKSGNKHKILDVKITQPEKPTEEEIPEAGKRSGLIQSLREQITVEPFKWDEEDEDSQKKEKNERSRQAVRNQSGNVTPFTWDVSESEQSSGGESPTKQAQAVREDADSKKEISTTNLTKETEKKALEVTALKDIRRPQNSYKLDHQQNSSKIESKDPKPQNSALKDGHIKRSGSISKIDTKDPKEEFHAKAGRIDIIQLKGQTRNKEDPVPKPTANSFKTDSKQQHNNSLTEDHSRKDSVKTKSSTTELKRKKSVDADDCSKQKSSESSTRPVSSASSAPNKSSEPAQSSSSTNSLSKSLESTQSTRQSSSVNSQSKPSDSIQSTRHSSSVNTPGRSVRGKEPSKSNFNDDTGKCSTRSSTKPFVRTSERQRLRQLSPNKFTRYSPSKSLSPLKKSLNHLRYRDKNGKNIRKSPIRISHHLEKNSRRNSEKSEEDRNPKSATNNDKPNKDLFLVSSSHRDSDKHTRTLKRENSDYDLHNNEKKLKSAVETSSTSSETSNSDNPSPVRRSKRRLERLHRKLCCDEDHEGDKKRKLDDATNCRHGPTSTCSSCVGKKVDTPLPAVVRRSSNYRRHSYHHNNIQEIKKVKHSSTPPTRNVTMVRVECDSPIKDPRGHQRSLSDRDRKQSDQDNKWKFRPRNKNKKYPYTYTRAREKE